MQSNRDSSHPYSLYFLIHIYLCFFQIPEFFLQARRHHIHKKTTFPLPSLELQYQVKPLNGESYDNLTEEYTRHRLSGNFSELKNLMSNLKSRSPRIDFKIIFSSSYRWLVRQPNQLKDSLDDLKEVVKLCKKLDCQNVSQGLGTGLSRSQYRKE